MECLKEIIGHETTLIVTCFECSSRLNIDFHGDCYEHTCLANYLDLSDESSPNLYEHYLDDLGIGKILLVGSPDCAARRHVLKESYPGGFGETVREELAGLPKSNHANFLNACERDVILTELNLVHQARKLMRVESIFNNISSGALTLQAVVVDTKRKSYREIFRNGIRFNDLISMQ